MHRRLALPLLLLLPASRLCAHDFWLERSGRSIHLCVGESLAGEERPLRADRALRAELRSASATLDLRPLEGEELLPLRLPSLPASAVFVYASRPARIALDPVRFHHYLLEEGQEAAIEERRRRGESLLPGREAYARAAKLLLGAPDPLLATRPAGLDLELLPEQDPRSLAAGERLTLRLLRSGRPLPSALLRLIHRPRDGAPAVTRGEERTDSAGRAAFPIAGTGFFLVKALHLERSARSDVEWESVWASLSFERLDPPP